MSSLSQSHPRTTSSATCSTNRLASRPTNKPPNAPFRTRSIGSSSEIRSTLPGLEFDQSWRSRTKSSTQEDSTPPAWCIQRRSTSSVEVCGRSGGGRESATAWGSPSRVEIKPEDVRCRRGRRPSQANSPTPTRSSQSTCTTAQILEWTIQTRCIPKCAGHTLGIRTQQFKTGRSSTRAEPTRCSQTATISSSQTSFPPIGSNRTSTESRTTTTQTFTRKENDPPRPHRPPNDLPTLLPLQRRHWYPNLPVFRRLFYHQEDTPKDRIATLTSRRSTTKNRKEFFT